MVSQRASHGNQRKVKMTEMNVICFSVRTSFLKASLHDAGLIKDDVRDVQFLFDFFRKVWTLAYLRKKCCSNISYLVMLPRTFRKNQFYGINVLRIWHWRWIYVLICEMSGYITLPLPHLAGSNQLGQILYWEKLHWVSQDS